MKKIVSVSLGSASRDHKVEIELLGEKFELSRAGVNGNFSKAISMIKDLDGKVDAIGLGGIDLYLFAGKRRYVIRDAQKLANTAKITPSVDGSGLKNTLERDVVKYIATETPYLKKGDKVLLVTAVDRFGMAQAFIETGCDIVFGDFLFALGLPIPIKTIRALKILAAILLPIFTRLPFQILYPTGEKQEKRHPKFINYFNWADVIAGDFHYIKRHMPDELNNKVIITNTVTQKDVEFLKNAGIKVLVTTTPEYEGRSFGTNVIEAMLVSILSKKVGESASPEEYTNLIKQLNLKPRIEVLN